MLADPFSLSQWPVSAWIAWVAVLGLLVGSFINVVVYRLPRMLDYQWRRECCDYLKLPEPVDLAAPVNLIWPLSHCPNCRAPIRPWHNIPVLSYLWLRGRCADCAAPIAWRYPAVETLSALLSALVAWRYGVSVQAAWMVLFTWTLLAAALIDLEHQILPDQLTLPLLWLGLLLSTDAVFVDSQTSILGAAAGYLSLWTVYQAFRLATGKEGMGYGDFKLLAALGAWGGWSVLPIVIILSSLVGAVLGVLLITLTGRDRQAPLPFGPFLAVAGWLALLWGDALTALWLG